MTRHTTATGPRLWFHLEEVLPLAEHAIACPTWRLTIDQTGRPCVQPALTWESAGGLELLSSNGVPAWHDESARIHTIAARVWQRTANSRAVASRSAGANRFWPLGRGDRAGGQLLQRISRWWPWHRPTRGTLIALLREGAARGGHWLVVETHHDSAGGSDRFRVVNHRDDIVPEDAVWEPAYVTSPAVWFGQYPALIAQGYTAHGQGDVIARFDRPTVLRMITCLADVHTDTNPDTDPMPGELAGLRFDGEVLVVSWSYDDGEREVWGEIDRVRPDRDGCYAVGAYLWSWEPVNVHAYSGREAW